MNIFTSVAALQAHLQPAISAGKSIGFVPTMGALHQGHLSLLERSLSENEISVMSIFVNPTQFNNADDLAKYPRTLSTDVQLIAALSEQVVVFAPEAVDIYGGEVLSQQFDFGEIAQVMEGCYRPGHFDGVGTVVRLLFEAVRPTRAYFGEKDYQQIAIVRKMVALTHSSVQIVPCPIVRESNGLAMSSRNARLSAQGKQQARFIFQALEVARTLFLNHTPEQVQQAIVQLFAANTCIDLEYFTIAHEQTLRPITNKEHGTQYRAFIVAHLEGVRLIDNAPLY